MSTLTYTPDEDIKVHEEGAIRLICRAYQSHEDGLPEWFKNSADAYSREDAAEAKRVLVVLFEHNRKGSKPSISCLDFSGMTSEIIERNFRVWADPEAARQGLKAAKVQGGHGNGGKCYMTQMFEEFSVLRTMKGNRASCYGIPAGSVKFGYVPDREKGRDFPVESVQRELDRVLKSVGCSIQALPSLAQRALKLADGFTMVTGVGPRGYGNRIPVPHLVTSLQEHPQMIRTLEMCKVYVIVNGEPFASGVPLKLPEIPPMDGGEQPRIVSVPDLLKEPDTGHEISTTDQGKLSPGTLVLRTSNVSMRYSKKGRHVVVYKAQSGYIGYDPIPSLDVESPYRDRIYGECTLEALERFKQNDRAALAKSPLTRALRRFVSEHVELYAREFEAKDRRRYRQEESNAISRMNEALDHWKNRFLNELMQGLWGSGQGSAEKERQRLPSGKPVKLELTFSYQKAGVGVAFRPTLRFLDEAGREIRSVPYRWISDDTNVAMADEDLNVINTFSYGKTGIYAETVHAKLKSNKVPLEVVHVSEIRVVPRELEIAAGTRHRLEALCQLNSKEEVSGVYLEWTENDSSIVRVSSSGLVYAFAPGQTEVFAMDDKCVAREPAIVRVIPGEGRATGDKRGKGYPRVLVSGEIDHDPDTNEYVHFSTDDPPVWQRPQDVDRNIWWINSAAPLARLYLETGKGYGYQSREWRMYHLERYIDVIVQIALTHGPTEAESLSPSDWILKWGSHVSEIQAAAASDLSEFIATGELPAA